MPFQSDGHDLTHSHVSTTCPVTNDNTFYLKKKYLGNHLCPSRPISTNDRSISADDEQMSQTLTKGLKDGKASSDVSDLISLSPITEDAVVQCLCGRYRQGKYYTKAGSTLVAVNPFKEVPDLYSSQTCKQVVKESIPHVYYTADQAYKHCQGDYSNANQSIIVSGESGAGKTVSAKHLLKYLTTVSQNSDSKGPQCNRIEQRILDSNPILEAFGNAMTVRNANSSRFGKYIQLQLQGNSEILGANIQTYLLEKTRIVHQSCRESNFHVFYQMLQGATAEERVLLNLGSCESKDFAYLKNGWRNNDFDRELWRVLNGALMDIGLRQEVCYKMFKLLSGILHLGNTTFDVDEDDDSCEITQSCLEDYGSLAIACNMIGLDQSKLEKSITHRQISASHARRKSIFYKPCSLKDCENRRDCLAKLLYSRLFDWLVDFINGTIQAGSCSKTIGILDIYGFESFDHNSLEQLCINYANEKLQQHFVKHFLKDLQEEYKKEAISWNDTSFVDNAACLELLECNPSLFALLNEECYLNRPSDNFALCDRLHSSLNGSHHWTRPRDFMRTPGFIIKHYAGSVQYGIEDLVDKNKDNIPPEFICLLQNSETAFVRTMFGDFEVDAVSKKRKTVLSKFKGSLDSLMTLLRGTNPHYIRCIKPNTESQPGVFDDVYVRRQLEACGVMATVHICKLGYPARFPYPEFLQRYGIILRQESSQKTVRPFLSDHSDDNKENEMMSDPLDVLYQKQLSMRTTPKKNATPKKRLRRRAGLSSDDHPRKCCATIMRDVFSAEYMRKSHYMNQFGRTKLFLKQGQLEELEKRRSCALGKYASTIQGAWKNHKKRKQEKLLHAVLRIQAAFRGWKARKDFRKRHHSAVVIQRFYRNYIRNCIKARTRKYVGESLSGEKNQTLDSISSQSQVGEIDLINGHPHGTETAGIGSASVNSLGSATTEFEKSRTENLTAEIGSASVIVTNESEDKSCKSAENLHLVRPNFILPSLMSTGKHTLPLPKAPLTQVLNEAQLGEGQTYPRIPYLEGMAGLISRRRMPRVPIKFHTRANTILKNAHLISQKEYSCSLTDCLPNYDEVD